MKIKTLFIIFYLILASITFITVKAIFYKETKGNKYAHILIQQEPDSLNPLFTSMSVAQEIQRCIYKPMVEIDEYGKPIPILVKNIPSMENNNVEIMPGGKIKVIWTFKEGLLWEDGYPLTIDDVIFTHKVIMDKRVWVRNRNLEKRIDTMHKDKDDPNKLIVIWKEPYAYYYKGHHILPKHIMKKEYNKNPAKLHLSIYNRKPIGNGPFKIKEWAIGSYILLTENEYYYKSSLGKKPKLNGIYYQFISNTNSMILSLLGGYADAISPIGLSFDQVVDFKMRYTKDFNAHIKDGIVWEHIDFNLSKPLLKDIRIRKAIIYAINREHIVKYFFAGKQKIADSWLPPRHPGYSTYISRYPYNKEKAIELLKKAGFRYINKDKIRMNEKGIPLNLTLITTAGNKIRERIQIAIKKDLSKIGINLKINKNQNAITLFGETIPKRQFDLAMYAWIFSPLSDGEEMWSSHSIPHEDNNYIGDNIPGYQNKEIDQIHKTIPLTLDKQTREELFAEQQRIWTKELPTIPLYFRAEVSITKKHFVNWKPTGTDTPITHNAEEWYIK